MVQEGLLELAAMERPAHEHDGVVRAGSSELPAHVTPEGRRGGHVVLPAVLVEPSRDDVAREQIACGGMPVLEAEPAGDEDLHRTPASRRRADG